MAYCYCTSISEVILRNLLRVKLVDPNIYIQIRLNIVLYLACLLELLCCSSQTVGKCLVSWGHPASLHSSHLFFVALLFFILAKKSGYWLHCLLWINWVEASSRLSSLHKLGNSPRSERIVLPWNTPLILRSIIGKFFSWRVLGKGGLKIRTIH